MTLARQDRRELGRDTRASYRRHPRTSHSPPNARNSSKSLALRSEDRTPGAAGLPSLGGGGAPSSGRGHLRLPPLQGESRLPGAGRPQLSVNRGGPESTRQQALPGAIYPLACLEGHDKKEPCAVCSTVVWKGHMRSIFWNKQESLNRGTPGLSSSPEAGSVGAQLPPGGLANAH